LSTSAWASREFWSQIGFKERPTKEPDVECGSVDPETSSNSRQAEEDEPESGLNVEIVLHSSEDRLRSTNLLTVMR
jgi:hypothetical protein